MKTIVLIGFAVAIISAFAMQSLTSTAEDEQFKEFISTFRKSYFSREEYNLRKANFNAFLVLVDQRNRDDTATHGITQFADLSQEEFMSLLGYRAHGQVLPEHDEAYTAPKDHDWSSHTTPVKDQASCGSCWAFSAVEAVETQNNIHGGKLVDLSEQQLVDCDPVSYGCQGGWMDSAIDYMEKQGDWSTESEYPYTARDGSCASKTGSFKLSISKHRETSTTTALA